MKEMLVSVLIAVRPLTLCELVVIAGLPAENWNDAGLIKEYVEQCGSFLPTRQLVVYFVHQSAKDYLFSTKALALSTNPAEENKMLTIRCFDYICSGVFQVGEIDTSLDSRTSDTKNDMLGIEDKRVDDFIPDKAPDLLKYPVLFWMAHRRLASRDIVDYFSQKQEL